jgi:hypothetical protein
MAPRMTNDEAIAALEKQLEETKAKAEETIKAKLAAVQAKLDAAKAKDEERTKTRIVKIDEAIVAAKASIEKANARLAKLEAEKAELTAADEVPAEDEQPPLVDDDRTETDQVTSRRRGKSDAA